MVAVLDYVGFICLIMVLSVIQNLVIMRAKNEVELEKKQKETSVLTFITFVVYLIYVYNYDISDFITNVLGLTIKM